MFPTENNIGQKRKSVAVFAVAVLVAVYILSVGGCDFANEESIVKETNEPHYRRGREELSRGNYQEAMSAFLKVVEKRKVAPESHLELGRIYLGEMNDPIFAIYHFRKFLEFMPNSPASPQVRQMIATANKRYAASLPESPFENNIRRLEFEEMWQKAQKENLELKHKLAAAVAELDKLRAAPRRSATPAEYRRSVVSEVSQPTQPPQQQQTSAKKSDANKVVVARDVPPSYVVQPGDTLSSISKRFYGTSRKWQQIFRANRDRLASPESVRPGQSLRLPR